MMRSLLVGLTVVALVGLPGWAAAQYPPSTYPPYQQTYPPLYRQVYPPADDFPSPMPNPGDIGGTWSMSGREDQPCEIILSRSGDRALFINEKGDRAAGFIRGNRIFIPKWSGGLRGDIKNDYIRWSNGTVWTR